MNMEGSVCSTTSAPSASSEPVARRMYQMTAAEFMPLPSMETMLARNTNLKDRFCRMLRMGRPGRELMPGLESLY